MTNKLGSSNPNRIPKAMNERLKEVDLNKGVNMNKDRRKKNRRKKNILIEFEERRNEDRRKKRVKIYEN